ncbi:MAG: ATP-binding protein [Bacteroidales bacterium]|nr:ATP-binding protein [Bacteroidales bacterium]MEE0267844.1 ATP-binding protein [Bacteroidales bacterium]
MSEGRIVKLICIVGTNGTGKTYFANKEFVQPEIARNGKVLVVTSHDNEWTNFEELQNFNTFRNGGKKIVMYPDEEQETIKRVSEKFYNGLLVLDDCGGYLGDKPPKSFKQLMINRKQLMLDIIFTAHSLRDLPKAIFSFNPVIILKNTTAGIEGREKILMANGALEKIEKAQIEIKKKIKKDPYYYKIITL